jgi:hypothetical protein
MNAAGLPAVCTCWNAAVTLTSVYRLTAEDPATALAAKDECAVAPCGVPSEPIQSPPTFAHGHPAVEST